MAAGAAEADLPSAATRHLPDYAPPWASSATSGEVGEEADERHHQEDHEQDLRDPGGAGGDAAEAQHRGDQRDDEKDHGVKKHDVLLRAGGPATPGAGGGRPAHGSNVAGGIADAHRPLPKPLSEDSDKSARQLLIDAGRLLCFSGNMHAEMGGR